MKLNYEIYQEDYRGPLEGLLDLARQQDLPLSKISLAGLVEDFTNHLEHCSGWTVGGASASLLIFSELLRLKIKELLPRSEEPGKEKLLREIGPEEKEFFVKVGKQLQEKAELRGRLYDTSPDLPEFVKEGEKVYKEVTLFELIKAFQDILVTHKRSQTMVDYQFSDEFTTEEQMDKIRKIAQPGAAVEFTVILSSQPGREEIVVTFIALLQLVKQSELRIVKKIDTDDIYIVGLNRKKQSDR